MPCPGEAVTGGRKTESFRPVILAVDDCPEDLGRVELELRKRYGADYRVVCERSPGQGMRKLRGLGASGERAALVIAAQRMAETEGVEFLSRVREVDPVAKQLLLMDPQDRGTADLLPRATALGMIDHFEFKPGPPPTSASTGSLPSSLRSGPSPTAPRSMPWCAWWASGGRGGCTRPGHSSNGTGCPTRSTQRTPKKGEPSSMRSDGARSVCRSW